MANVYAYAEQLAPCPFYSQLTPRPQRERERNKIAIGKVRGVKVDGDSAGVETREMGTRPKGKKYV